MTQGSEEKDEYESKYMKFQIAEARWLDSVVRPMVPTALVWLVEDLAESKHLQWLARLLHFLIDTIWIGAILRVRITRNSDLTYLQGKGFRAGFGARRLDTIRTKVTKRGKQIAEEKFPVGVIIQ